MKKAVICSIFVCLIISSCASIRNKTQKSIKNLLNTSFYENQFTGLVVLDPIAKDTILNVNGKKYFTPASTTKIFTLFASLQLLPEHLPTLKYITQNDTLYIQGTGAPTTLHARFKDTIFTQFLKEHKHIAVDLNNFKDQKYGPGWAWEDYAYYYQPEKSGFPLYGNTVRMFQNEEVHVIPDFFKDKVILQKNTKNRELNSNQFYLSPLEKDTLEIPYITDHTLTKRLLENTLKKEITLVSKMPQGKKTVLYGIAVDSVYKHMMLTSDNFIAEQLLITASSSLSDTLNTVKAQDYILKTYLNDLKQSPRWVDGSGLSRYNLFTPESMVHVLEKLYTSVPNKERLFNFFPTGGVSKGLKDWYKGDPHPYIYAKTGSLGNNHSLSGYLITKSGKTLIFSFMNNHYKKPSSEVKQRMQLILEKIRDTY